VYFYLALAIEEEEEEEYFKTYCIYVAGYKTLGNLIHRMKYTGGINPLIYIRV
jgi:hypothetical protein